MEESPEATDKTPLLLPTVPEATRTNGSSTNNGQRTINPKTQNSMKYMAPFLIVVFLERFTYYSIVVNLFLFFRYDVYDVGKHRSTNDALVSVMFLVGLSWLFCVLGGWISDAKLGKLRTIIWGLVIYCLGVGLLLLSAWLLEQHILQRVLYRALPVFGSILIAVVGEGAYKANIAAFGAEQLDCRDHVSTRRYFNMYYFFLNVGSLFALSISAFVQQSYGFVYGFAMPFGSIVLALVVFILSRKHYKTLPCQRIVGKVYQIVKEARKNYRIHEKSSSPITIQQKLRWLDHARMKYGGSFLDWEVDEVKFVLAVVPVFILLLPYQTIYNQMSGTFLQQGIHMKPPRIGIAKKSFPAAWLYLFDSVIIIILLPVTERFVYPWLAKRGYKMIPLTRISIGIMVSCLAVIAAGFVEVQVIDAIKKKNTVKNYVNVKNVTAADISIFYQLPQYTLIGVSEVFAAVGGLEFAYRNAPRSMQGLIMSLYFAVISLGSLLGSALLEISVVAGIVERNEKTKNHYDLTYYFYLLAGLMLLSWIIFIIYVERKRCERSKQPRTRMFNRPRGPNSPDINSDIHPSITNNT